jgi:hypothetical protein
MSELIGIREAARRLGVSDTAVHKAIKSGRVQIAGRTENSNRPLVSWPEVHEDWHKNSNAAMRFTVGPRKPKPVVSEPVQPEPVEVAEVVTEPEPVVTEPEPVMAEPVEVLDPEPPKRRASRIKPNPVDLEQFPQISVEDAPSLMQSKALREAYMAQLAKLEYEKAIGKVVDADAVKVEAFKTARQVRDGLMNIPDRVAAELAHETNPAHIHARLQREIRDVLQSLSATV